MQLFTEGADLGGGGALGAIEAEGEAEDELFYLSSGNEFGDALDGIGGAYINGFHRVGHDAYGVGSGDADAGVSVVDG